MTKYTHDFVETYEDMIGFGLDRRHDENTLICYLQMFSDDTVMRQLVKRMTDDELEEIFILITRKLKNHFTEPEYHALFLKEEDPHD